MKLKLKAPAKINLGLSILGQGENNYHKVKTIYTQIDLFDLIEIEEINGENIELKVNRPEIPVDKDNLIWQAVEILRQAGGVKKGLKINLRKRIPEGTGLGGGSSDAAAVLKALNKRWGLNYDLKKLVKLSKKIGADVAYQLTGGVKLEVQGGDKAGQFEDLGRLPESYFLIVVDKEKRSSGEAYKQVDKKLIGEHSLEDLVKAIKKRDLSLMGKNLVNDFENWALKEYPRIKEVKKLMMEGGAVGSLMSGKGLTVFGVFKQRQKAEELYNRLKNEDKEVYLTKPFYD